MQTAAERRRPATPVPPKPAAITEAVIRAFLADLTARGRSKATVRMYAARLRTLWDDLPPDKLIQRGTLAAWRDTLLSRGYSPSTVNTHLSAANSLLEYMDRRDLKLAGQLDAIPETQPELTRTEYLRLLQAARILERARLYLLVKVFALTGIRVGELHRVTIEAVNRGWIEPTGSEQEKISIPECLQKELADYIVRHGIQSGPVFVSRTGHPLRRTQVTAEIHSLSRDARVEKAKCSPRCLRRLYQATRTEIDRSMRFLTEQAYEQLLETEQLAAGWEMCDEHES